MNVVVAVLSLAALASTFNVRHKKSSEPASNRNDDLEKDIDQMINVEEAEPQQKYSNISTCM